MMKRYVYAFSKGKPSPVELIRWMRRNCGKRGIDWDFDGSGLNNTITLLIWNSKAQFMYEMWHR